MKEIIEVIKTTLNLNIETIEERKKYIGISDEDIKNLKIISQKLSENELDIIFKEFYEYLQNFKETKKILRNANIPNLIEKQKKYFRHMLDGKFNEEYIEERLKVGVVHQNLNLKAFYFIGAYSRWQNGIIERLKKKFPAREVVELIVSLSKCVKFDIMLVLDVYHFAENLDPLTNTLSRSIFLKYVEIEIHNAKRYNYPLSLIMYDVDNFKFINDTYGHSLGDKILKETAILVRESIRKGDIFCRWGGDEFLILLPHTNVEGAKIVAEKILKRIKDLKIDSINVSVSIGVSEFEREKDKNFNDLFTKTDKALYKAKKLGRNRIALSS